MKKFLTTIIVIIVAVSLGFGVFYLVKDNEVISLKTASLYKNVNESFELGLDLDDPNSYTKVEVYSTDNNVVEVKNQEIKISGKRAVGEFVAKTGGVAKIVFKTNNAKFRNVSCDIIVCDGTIAYPFRISTAEELASIGTSDVYTSEKCYELTNNIDLGTVVDYEHGETWRPLPELKGGLNGNGFTIENLVVGGSSENLGLFSSINASATVQNIKFEGVKLNATGNTTQYVGAVAGTNYGTVKRIEILNADAVVSNNRAYVGAVAGQNRSVNLRNRQTVANIDRASAKINFAGSYDGNTGVAGNVGGIVGYNYGGRLYFAYTTGTLNTNDSEKIVSAGGLVGVNEYLPISGSGSSYTTSLGADIQECYSIVNITSSVENKTGVVIGLNKDVNETNKYYNVISGVYFQAMGNEAKAVGVDNSKGSPLAKIFESKDGGENGYLKDLYTLVSAKIGEKELKNNSGNLVLVPVEGKEATVYYWNTNVWQIVVGKNEGYPVINFDEVDANPISDNNSQTIKAIDNINDLMNIDLSANTTYVIDGTLDFTGVTWTPIGTKEQPFNGIIYVRSGEFRNLTLDTTDAGIFGYTGSTAVIDGITINNCHFTGTVAGAIVAHNNGLVSNYTVLNSTVSATKSAGGVVGENNGTIIAFNQNQKSLNAVPKKGEVNETVVSSDIYAGGIVGMNGSLGIISAETDYATLLSVTVTNKTDKFANVYIGGVAGYADGAITTVNISNSELAIGDTAEAGGKASIGGIVGYLTNATAERFYIKDVTIDARTNEGSYAGGVVGQVFLKNRDRGVRQVVVEACSITGHKAGGVTGSLNVDYDFTVNAEQISWVFPRLLWTEATYTTVDSGIAPDIMLCQIKDTKMFGTYTGGVVCDVIKGSVANIEVSVKMSGKYNAGIVNTIKFNSETKEGGLVYNVVSTSSYGSGDCYATSMNSIHNQPLLDKRNCGFVMNYHYVGNKRIKEQRINGFTGTNGLSDKDFKKASNWSFLDSENIWNVKDGKYPTLKASALVVSSASLVSL